MSHIIELSPHRNGWKAFEAPGVEPYFVQGPDGGKAQAINYARQRLGALGGEIRVVNAAGELLETIAVEGHAKQVS